MIIIKLSLCGGPEVTNSFHRPGFEPGTFPIKSVFEKYAI